ncbi:MAG TPA: acyl-CoA desaturase, partial [Nocardioidaceae bacterium]|nr:acyl-CoA desaturase [Nocardioidaceae bacterium]
HKSYKPNRAVKVFWAIAGSMAIQGPVIRWVADHRKHHKFSDRDGDPHSPWRYGNDIKALTKGLFHAHMMWLFNPEQTPQRKYAPDLMKDDDIVRVSRQFPIWVAVSLIAPAVAGGLLTMSWQGALTAFFWGSLVRVSLLHHVTWSINSICHAVGDRPFVSRDKSANVWWLAIPSMGESWHNLHHADPTCARHGVMKGQLDTSARVIWALEKAGWVHDVRWPVKERIDSKLVKNADPTSAAAA